MPDDFFLDNPIKVRPKIWNITKENTIFAV